MILPAGVDIDNDDEATIVEKLVASGAYDQETAEAVAAMLKDPDAEPLE